MVKNKFYTILLFILTLVLLTGVIYASEQIRPASQTDSRGTEEQIRPANQQNLPSDGNGGYKPTQGSDYQSYTDAVVVPNSNIVKMKAVLNGTNSNTTLNANGTGSFVLNKTSNIIEYNITYSELSSNATGAEITIDAGNITNGTRIDISFENIRFGVVSYLEELESYILDSRAVSKIESLFFPEGEISGRIEAVNETII